MPQLDLTIQKLQNGTALLISPAECDHDFLGGLFSAEGWTLYSAPSVASASALLREKPVCVVITERDLPVGGWKDVLEVLQLLRNPPLVVVTSALADEYLWAEALNLGAYDVLVKPFNRMEVIRVLTSAWNRNTLSQASSSEPLKSRMAS